MNSRTERPCRAEHPTPAATAWRCSSCARELTGLAIPLRRRGVCVHLGDPVRLVECDSCTGRVSLKVYACQLLGETTLSRPVSGVRGVCDRCQKFSLATAAEAADKPVSEEPKRDTFSLISPIGTSQHVDGLSTKKPWNYRATAIIPHLNTPDCLKVVIGLLRLQTEPPYIVVVDTGSPFRVCDELEQLRSDDCEIHFVRSNAYTHSSEPVCVALDVGFARVNTELIFLTHTDCFPTKRDALKWLGDQCNVDTPVIGWEMSERSWITDKWQGVVSHTFTMLHSLTMRSIGASWHMQRARDMLGQGTNYRSDGWPDTETGFAMCLKEAGIPVKLLGHEINHQRQITDWWDHARSFTGTNTYGGDGALANTIRSYFADAMSDAKRRLEEWKRPRTTRPSPARRVRVRK